MVGNVRLRHLGAWAGRLPQSVRFLAAGGFAAGINWAARFPLSLFMPFVSALLCATVIGMGVGFVLYQAFVFPGSRRPLLPRLRDFVLVNLAGSAGVIVVAVVVERMLLHTVGLDAAEAAAHAVGIAAGAVLNFVGHRSFTFRDIGNSSDLPVESGK